MPSETPRKERLMKELTLRTRTLALVGLIGLGVTVSTGQEIRWTAHESAALRSLTIL
jgi:hypothetical protein